MFFLFLLPSFIFITARANELTFTTDIEKLEKCIEYYLMIDSHMKIGNNAEDISQIVARRFYSKSFTSHQFYKATNNMYYLIRDVKSAMFKDNKVPNELQMAIRRALENCVERKNLPVFVLEAKVLANFLDYVLVDWPTPLNEMISTRHGRSTLRLYAYATGLRLMSALRYFSMNFKLFRRGLRKNWMLRADRFFDGCNAEFIYIRHRFTTDRDRMYSSIPLQDVHTIDDVSLFASRSSQNFSSRNPTIESWNANQLSSMPDVGSYDQRSKKFFESSSTSSADIYLQDHLDQCYQIIFFILELQLRGINTDEDDIWNGPIPSDVLPLPIQLVAWNREAYQIYLEYWSDHNQQLSSEELNECYTKEDLIMLLSLVIIKKNSRNTFRTTTISTTTSTTEFPWNKGSKKGGARTGNCGKYFLPKKKFKIIDQHQGLSDENTRNYGCIIDSQDSYQLILHEDIDPPTFSNVLVNQGSFSHQ